jgi:NAD-dependent SIR2 family protein deacetylase
MKRIECKECGDMFDPNSFAKKRAGGLAHHCPQCSSETEVKHLGLAASDGKFAQITILSFQTQEDREKYKSFHQNNSGLHKGKSCQLGNHLSTTPAVKFKTVQAFKPTNHKGKSV